MPADTLAQACLLVTAMSGVLIGVQVSRIYGKLKGTVEDYTDRLDNFVEKGTRLIQIGQGITQLGESFE